MRLVLFLVLIFTVNTAYTQDNKTDPTSEKKVPFMFVQTAESGTFQANTDGSGFKLTLKNIAPQTIFFSDRPSRVAGGVPNKNFLKNLGFDVNNPPNAAVVISEPKSKDSDIVVVTLANPVYDPETETLVYDAKLLENSTGPGLAFWSKEKDKSLPPKFSHVSVFIDDCPDGPAYCYGNYEYGGRKKCRTNCGPLDGKVGYCWSTWTLSCKPCQNYLDKCKARGGPCVNSADPGCTARACSTSQDCM